MPLDAAIVLENLQYLRELRQWTDDCLKVPRILRRAADGERKKYPMHGQYLFALESNRRAKRG
jgi:hypothetical protein